MRPLIVVGEAPGSTEIKTGIPFSGAGGKFLQAALGFVGIDCANVTFCNVFAEPLLSPDGRKNRPPSRKELFEATLKFELPPIQDAVVLALGASAAKVVANADFYAINPSAARRSPKMRPKFYKTLLEVAYELRQPVSKLR